MLDELAILGICGFSGSGKTTLIEQLIPGLLERGLRVAVAKHDAHGLDIDRPGKDSDRFYRAGADVVLGGPDEEVTRSHRPQDGDVLVRLAELAERYDVILVEGRKHTPLPKLWLLNESETAPPDGVTDVLTVLGRNEPRVEAARRLLDELIEQRFRAARTFAGILIGGRSSRMGRPKHLLAAGGRTWLRRTVDVLGPLCDDVVLLGAGELPSDVGQRVRLPDVPGVAGPLAGALAAMRWAPRTSWLLVACDLPGLSPEAVRWLLDQRAPGRWAILPKRCDAPGCEPLLACYDFRCRAAMERLARTDSPRLCDLAADGKVWTPTIPQPLAAAWHNCNSPADLPDPAPR